MKKIISLIMALALIASFSITALAAENITNNVPDTSGSITINGISEGNVYAIYKLLHLESYDVSAGAYAYKASADWVNFFKTTEAKAYMSTDADGYVTWTTTEDDDTKAAFAKLALDYAQANGISPVKSSTNAGEFVVTESSGKFSELELGYYLVDSTMGALCGLTTTNPDASINAKNGTPTIDKQVEEDSTLQWGASNSADIGQGINYRVTINVHAGAQNYVLHDTMEDGLTFGSVTGIDHVVPGVGTTPVDPSKYEVKTVADGVTDGCDFEIHFSQALCDELETNDKLIVHYNAKLNEKATIGNEDSNDNTAWLTFGTPLNENEPYKSNVDTVSTYTYGFDLVKTDSSNKLIDGAEFKIYDAATDGDEIAVVQVLDSHGDPVLVDGYHLYRKATAEETGTNVIVVNGKVRVNGLDNGTYYLDELIAPDGFNKLSARQKFIISDNNLDATFNGTIYSSGSGVHVVNKNGTMLPETGGMGTVLFITFGTIVVLCAGVLLVTKKRMSMIKD
ncbi:MAG: isopeptide-forming domain-containing fimbrial protein [Ruminococcaceae bacterium]|nr:isopeptide-forming domain-containing fimbrial protein [Oscillospiraceae bacterium]